MNQESQRTLCLHSAQNYRCHCIGAVFLSAVLLGAVPTFALDIEPLWVADPDMIMEGAPMVADLDGDGNAEVLTAAYESLIVVDSTGNERWRYDTRGRYSTCPTILERQGGSPLIYAGDNQGLFTCLDGSGNVVWQRDLGPMFCSSPVIADLDGDGRPEVVQGEQGGLVVAMDALSGDVLWSKQLEGACSNPAASDLNGDSSIDLLFATGEGKLHSLSASGEEIWQIDLGSTAPFWAIASPVVYADSKNNLRIAVAGHDGILFCLDNQGKTIWLRSTRGGIASTISVADFDANGRADLFVVTELGVLYRFDEDGRVLWDIDTQGRSLAPGAIVDLDGDGNLEYMLSTQAGNLLVFDSSGAIVYNHQFDNRTVNVTPTCGDIIASRPGLEFAVTGGESGRIFCFGTTAPVDSATPWRTYRGDDALTGAWFGLSSSDSLRMTPENLNWAQLLTGGDVTFRIVNPTASSVLSAEASCLQPDGSRQAAVGKVIGEQGLLKLPVTIAAPGIYKFEWTLKNEAGKNLLSGTEELTLQPYQNDQALGRRAVLALREAGNGEAAASTDKGLQGALHQEALAMEIEANELAALQAAVPGSPPEFVENVKKRTAALNTRAERNLSLAKVASSAAQKTDLVAFEGTMWENRDVNAQLPTEIVTPLTITRRCIPGEHEPVSIKLLNVTLDALTTRVRIETQPNGPQVTAYEVKPVPTNLGETAWDPIVPVQGELTVPSLETREVWLDIDLSEVVPGDYSVDVVFDTPSTTAKATVALNVLPFTMAEPGAMRLCCWASYNDDAVQDLLKHGNNVFTGSLPPVTVEEGSPPKLIVDFTALDEFIAPLLGHDVVLLLGGIPALGVPMEEEAYVPRLSDYFEQVMSHLADKGISEDHVALYPHDEPGGAGWDTVNHYVAFGKQGLKARPNLKFYVNGGGDLAMFEALNLVASIWSPSYYMLDEQTPEMDFLRKSGKTLWSYDCGYAYARPIGANTKTINVVVQYRLAAIFGWNLGATGIGYWCYNVGDSLWDAAEFEYALVYTNPDGTQTSCRRWEAVRESMEDTRILIALRDKLSDDTVSAEAKTRIRRLLDDTVSSLAKQALAQAHLGVARYAIDASNNDQTVEALREEMMDCVALLSK